MSQKMPNTPDFGWNRRQTFSFKRPWIILISNVCLIKNRSKHSSNTLLCLLRIFMRQTLYNVWVKKTETLSSDKLLWFVSVFLTQTLRAPTPTALQYWRSPNVPTNLNKYPLSDYFLSIFGLTKKGSAPWLFFDRWIIIFTHVKVS